MRTDDTGSDLAYYAVGALVVAALGAGVVALLHSGPRETSEELVERLIQDSLRRGTPGAPRT